MKWNKEQILDFLEDRDEDTIWFIDKEKNKSSRTRQQEKTWYKLFGAIATHESSQWETVNKQEVKLYMLGWCFWTHKLKLSKSELEVPNKSETSKLTKEEGIFFIDTLLLYCKVKKVPVKITSREIDSLYESFNN